MAQSYSETGFAGAVDDVMLPEDANYHYVPLLTGRRVSCVLLRPTVETALAHNRDRTNKPSATCTKRCARKISPQQAGVVDNSEQTVAAI